MSFFLKKNVFAGNIQIGIWQIGHHHRVNAGCCWPTFFAGTSVVGSNPLRNRPPSASHLHHCQAFADAQPFHKQADA